MGRGWALTQVTRGPAGPAAAQKPNAKKSYFGYTLRTPRWRYTEWDQGNQGKELYDHDKDASELSNLADQPEYAKTIDQLSSQLRIAVKESFPPSGETPEVKPMLWAPLLIEP